MPLLQSSAHGLVGWYYQHGAPNGAWLPTAIEDAYDAATQDERPPNPKMGLLCRLFQQLWLTSTISPQMPLLEIHDLQLDFVDGANSVRALDSVSLSLDAGETLCLVGESGSGKTVTALSIARLLPSPPAQYRSGRVLLAGRDVLKMSNQELRSIRGRMVGYVFQEASSALNPVMRIGTQIEEVLKLHHPEAATRQEMVRLLKTVGLPSPESRLRNYAHELSGGMQQRVLIAMALAARPSILVADEPTTALDVTIQAQILELLSQLKREFEMAILFITHNLGIVADLADRAAVMYAGQIIETGPARELLRNPLHPYTKALIATVPSLGSDATRLNSIPGAVPTLGAWPSGCRFHPRCQEARPECSQKAVTLATAAPERAVRCPYANFNHVMS